MKRDNMFENNFLQLFLSENNLPTIYSIRQIFWRKKMYSCFSKYCGKRVRWLHGRHLG